MCLKVMEKRVKKQWIKGGQLINKKKQLLINIFFSAYPLVINK